jgi:hypothetical protein
VFLFLTLTVDFAWLAARLDNTAVAVCILADLIALLGFSLTITVDLAGTVTRLNHPAIAVGILADITATALQRRCLLRILIAVGHTGLLFGIGLVQPRRRRNVPTE